MLEPLRDTFLAIKHPCMLMLFKNQKCADFDPVFDICLLINTAKRKVRGTCICMNLRFFIRLMKIARKFAYRLSNLSEITTLAGSLYCKPNIMINDDLLVF